jgi:hypothetical protein
MANSQKIHELINTIQLNEDQLYMGAWISTTKDDDIPKLDCGFVACAAGWTLINEGYTPVWNERWADWEFMGPGPEAVIVPNGDKVGIVAAEILDIEYPEGPHLFGCTNWHVDQVTTALKFLAEGYTMEHALFVVNGTENYDDC